MSKTPSPNIYGIETEYSCMLTFPGDKVYEIVGSCHSKDKELGLYEEPKDKGMNHVELSKVYEALGEIGIYSNGSGMLSNGGRLYVDPSGPEYCNPETSSAEEAVLRTFEGDQIVHSIFDYLVKKEQLIGYQLNRRIVDHNRSSRGIHLNTLTELDEKPTREQIMLLATLNVAKGALFGSGGLLVNKKGNTEYHHSPRLSITTDIDAQYSNYKKRPLVRIPFKDDIKSNRIETVSGDALNFGWPLKASLVVTNALVAMMETESTGKLPVIGANQAIGSAINVGKYGHKGRIAIENSESYKEEKALVVLREICEVILNSTVYLDDESRQTLEEVIIVADSVARDPLNGVKSVESIARWEALKKRMVTSGEDLGSERLCRTDYGWDLIGNGYAETLRNRRGFGWLGFSEIPSNKRVQAKISTPPTDTRAKVRGERIKINVSQGNTDNSNWLGVDYGDDHPRVLEPWIFE